MVTLEVFTHRAVNIVGLGKEAPSVSLDPASVGGDSIRIAHYSEVIRRFGSSVVVRIGFRTSLSRKRRAIHSALPPFGGESIHPPDRGVVECNFGNFRVFIQDPQLMQSSGLSRLSRLQLISTMAWSSARSASLFIDSEPPLTTDSPFATVSESFTDASTVN